eukprot:212194_1
MGVVSALDDHENKMSDYSDEFVDLDRKMEWIKQRIQNKQVTYIILYHDESTIHKMEHSLYGWCHKEVSRFLPKSVGKGYNISDFITAYDGFLKVNDDDTARVIHKVGGDTDKGEFYWNNVKMIQQCLNASRIFKIKFNLQSDDDLQWIRPVWCFDNAPCHRMMPKNALNSTNMNVKAGGKAPIMKDGWYMDGEEKIDQEMYFCRDMDEEVVPKGLKQILVERGIEVDKLHNALKKDNPYCEIIFFPRYHCELNPIENVWMISKQKFRLEQDFESKTHAKMIETINNCLDAIPLDTIQRFVQTSIMYCELYRTGNGSEAALEKIKEIKKLKRKHRRAPLMQINHN